MAPRRKSVQERLAEAHSRTHKLSQAAAVDDCIRALRAHSALANRVREFLVTAGVDFSQLGDEPATGDAAETSQPQAILDRQAAANPLDIPTDEFDRLPLCDTTLGLLKVERLKAILLSLDEVTFTEHSIKALVPKGRRQVNKTLVLQVIELLTNWGTEQPLNAVKSLHFLISQVKSAAEELGARSSRLRLPPVWKHDGVYILVVTGCMIAITNRFTTVTVTLDGEQQGIEDSAAAEVIHNWSENSARIVANNGAYSKLLILFFVGEKSEATMITKHGLVKRPLMLENGTLTSPSKSARSVTGSTTSGSSRAQGSSLMSSPRTAGDRDEQLPQAEALPIPMPSETITEENLNPPEP